MPPDSRFVTGDRVRVINGDAVGRRGVIIGPGVGKYGGETTWRIAWSHADASEVRESFLEHDKGAP